MITWKNTLFLIAFHVSNLATARSVPVSEPAVFPLCPLESTECCKYESSPIDYKRCCEKYGCCQPCKVITLPLLGGPYEFRQNCTQAWECCRFEFLSPEFNGCCNDHGCCPRCGDLWSQGCNYNRNQYKFGEVIETSPDRCIKLVCTAKTSVDRPYVIPTVEQMSYNPKTNAFCQDVVDGSCVDPFGILRYNGEEWFMSAKCEQCQCQNGDITCLPVRRPCPLPDHPNCLAIAGGCCPIYDCDGNRRDCETEEGFVVPFGQALVDPRSNCVSYECTIAGLQTITRSCLLLPPQPDPSCIRTTDDFGCCERWECDGGCPDPNSFNKSCFQFIDQCESDTDCQEGLSCCLVAGCGKECMRLCVDEFGLTHKLGDIWSDPNLPSLQRTCLTDGIQNFNDIVTPTPLELVKVDTNVHVAKSTTYTPPTKSKSIYECLIESGLDLNAFAEDLEKIQIITDAVPLKASIEFVEEFRTIAIERSESPSLDENEVLEIVNLAQAQNWSSIIPILNQDTRVLEMEVLSEGDVTLQRANVIDRIISEETDPLEKLSPSEKHQRAFRRTDEISIQMGQLGPVMETATKSFAQRLDVPTAAIGALSIVGDAIDCDKRFSSFLRPTLAPPCDPSSPFRTLDGTCNNLDNNLWGAAFTKFRRILDQDYGDGISSLRLSASNEELPSARLVSTSINIKPNEESSSLSFLHVTYGQFLDHDLTATPIARGYLGSTIKCCDDLRTSLEVALNNVDDIKISLDGINKVEPSLTSVFSGLNLTSDNLKNNIQIVQDLILSMQANFEIQLDARPPRQVSVISDVVTSLTLPRRISSAECAPIPIPKDDPFYSCHSQTCMEFVRSIPAPVCSFGRREQLNQHTAYIDGSVIYGAKEDTLEGLRLFEDGLLKTQVTLHGETLLPAEEDLFDGCNTDEHSNNGRFCFKAGDGRVNEQILLTFFQTVWAREHNRVAHILKSFNNIGWDDERLFQEARRIVVAELQHVTYNEYIPSVLGSFLTGLLDLKPLTDDQYTMDYDENLDASIANAFATAAYRFGHSQITDFLQKVNKHGTIHTQPFSSILFHPFSLYDEDSMEDLARGGTSYPSRKVNPFFTEEISGNLFKGQTPFGLDLVALNIQRGRDHGLPGYIHWKAQCSGELAAEFNDLTDVMDEDIVEALESVYEAVGDIDLYAGGVAERPFLDGILGPTFTCIIADQFLRIKRGDRFWYEYKDGPGAFTTAQLKELHKVTLARILCNNLPELHLIQPEPLKNPSEANAKVYCSSIPDYSLSPWNIFGFASS